MPVSQKMREDRLKAANQNWLLGKARVMSNAYSKSTKKQILDLKNKTPTKLCRDR
jgi:hypothetical protein